MGTKIILPNGALTSNEQIQTVSPTRKGVVCQNSQGRVLAWIPVADPVKAKEVLRIMSEFVMAGNSAVQPDWSFLLESTSESK